jgi:beta-galactosidase GanA
LLFIRHALLSKLLTASLLLGSALAAQAQSTLPRLVKTGPSTQLLVEDKPYLILGGELGNSSSSSTAYMQPIWPKLQAMHLNTVFAPVYWELLEPTEGQFDFKLVDELLADARKHHIKLVLLWFGAWKNSMSVYAPAWVKTNPSRFPRATDAQGRPQEIMTPFSPANLEADKKAFVRLMQHLKQTDSRTHTVLMVQVENEIGMLPEARSYDAAAQAAFAQPVPEKLLTYLQRNSASLRPEFAAQWQRHGAKTQGTWTEVFGPGVATDEIFQAWYYADFTNALAAAGKAAYPLPMYVNAALNYRADRLPGQYPSAGPLPHLADVWEAGAPAIDILAPDYYNPNFRYWSDLFTRSGRPLFTPEIAFEPGDDAKALYAFGRYNCLSFSPFSIESTDKPAQEPIGKAYDLLQQVTPLLTHYQPLGAVRGFMQAKDSAAGRATLGNYRFTVKHDNTLGWTPESKKTDWPLTGGLIISVAPDEFYVVGTGLVITCEPTAAGKKAGFVSIDEGRFINGAWTLGRRLNGDQDHQGRHIRLELGSYDIQHVKLYTY